MYPPSQAAYDRAITVFSPDGRLFQVEYAREAVKTGATSIGMVCKDAVVLLAQKRISSPLIVKGSHEKIYQIDSHVVASSSGLVADARKLVDIARLEAQKHRLTYDQAISTEQLAKKIGDHIQAYTQYGGVRPYGVSLLVAGSDGEMRLFETEPSGAIFEYKATAIGSGKKEVEEMFEKEFKEDLSLEECLKLCMKALKKVTDIKLAPDLVDVAIIRKSTSTVEFLPLERISALLKA
ncbi:TPA: archaeal proteasome endopeptidase complex subunit alpha [Candidatus Micrarchaeota archaeon]|nr:archaeal proteasome endopeptidase complex subunit alpha [Candidatus Micrarchaeota archaeon]